MSTVAAPPSRLCGSPGRTTVAAGSGLNDGQASWRGSEMRWHWVGELVRRTGYGLDRYIFPSEERKPFRSPESGLQIEAVPPSLTQPKPRLQLSILIDSDLRKK